LAPASRGRLSKLLGKLPYNILDELSTATEKNLDGFVGSLFVGDSDMISWKCTTTEKKPR
jgi:hypothetical protein